MSRMIVLFFVIIYTMSGCVGIPKNTDTNEVYDDLHKEYIYCTAEVEKYSPFTVRMPESVQQKAHKIINICNTDAISIISRDEMSHLFQELYRYEDGARLIQVGTMGTESQFAYVTHKNNDQNKYPACDFLIRVFQKGLK